MATSETPREPEPVIDPRRAGDAGMRPERGDALRRGDDFGKEAGQDGKSLEALEEEDE
jgi:hypothetical protein